ESDHSVIVAYCRVASKRIYVDDRQIRERLFRLVIIDFFLIAQIGRKIGQDGAVARPVARRFQNFGALGVVIAIIVIQDVGELAVTVSH
ncbi:hypothetical protein ACSTJG_25065, partial [Vibrio parahaemolyticus]